MSAVEVSGSFSFTPKEETPVTTSDSKKSEGNTVQDVNSVQAFAAPEETSNKSKSEETKVVELDSLKNVQAFGESKTDINSEELKDAAKPKRDEAQTAKEREHRYQQASAFFNSEDVEVKKRTVVVSKTADDVLVSKEEINGEKKGEPELMVGKSTEQKSEVKTEPTQENPSNENAPKYTDAYAAAIKEGTETAKTFLGRTFNKMAGRINQFAVYRMFRKAQEYKIGDFKFKLYRTKEGVIACITKYIGSSGVVTIPSAIRTQDGSIAYVQYISENFLFASSFSNYGVRKKLGFVGNLFRRKDSIDSLDWNTDVRCGMSSIEEVILPEGLVAIFPNSFYNCNNLKSVIIPSTCMYVSDKAFNMSGVEDIYFNGDVPSSFDKKAYGDISIFVRPQYLNRFRGVS